MGRGDPDIDEIAGDNPRRPLDAGDGQEPWRIFSLALHGRKSGIDWAGYRSASAFDLAYFFFFIFLLPWVWRFIKDRRFISPYMLFWIPAIILVPILYVYLWPDLPYFSSVQLDI